MGGRVWTRAEIAKLYDLAGRCSQSEAAALLGRTHFGLMSKSRELGIYWSQGTWSYQAIADEVGCSPTSVRRLVDILFSAEQIRGAGQRGTPGWRARLTENQAQRVITVLHRARTHRADKIRAGLARHGRAAETS